ncbi:MBL fold metallo-hydrolase [Pueribacillus theae]|uniref:MBL fold metallo-hydrolase n=1 Tax=Pueribacillus theae TaxID=2171751 RepID=UPI0014020ACE|nr:MBL fold metallo-hydrolase [Pueribacillus theae]
MNNKIKIIRVPVPTPTLWPNTTTNSYLIGNEQESLLVDAGYDRPETKEELEKAIKENKLAKPDKIVLTHSHPDHAPGVRRLADWSPLVYCHKNEKEEIKKAISPMDHLAFLEEGDILAVAGVKITIIHGPGHTSGQLNLYIPSAEILIAGDNIVAEGTTWIGAPDGDMRDYLDTLHRLKQLKLKKIGPGHGEWVLSPYEQIDFVINRRLQREKQIKSFLEEKGSLTSTQLTEMIYENTIHPSVFDVARRTTEAHLAKLMKEGLVSQKDSVYSLNS